MSPLTYIYYVCKCCIYAQLQYVHKLLKGTVAQDCRSFSFCYDAAPDGTQSHNQILFEFRLKFAETLKRLFSGVCYPREIIPSSVRPTKNLFRGPTPRRNLLNGA